MCFVCNAVRPHIPDCPYTDPGIQALARTALERAAGQGAVSHDNTTAPPVLRTIEGNMKWSIGPVTYNIVQLGNAAELAAFNAVWPENQGMIADLPAIWAEEFALALRLIDDLIPISLELTEDFDATYLVGQQREPGTLGAAIPPVNRDVDFRPVVGFDLSDVAHTTNAEIGGGSDRFQTIVHEFLHTLGLSHPHDTSGNTTTGVGATPDGESMLAPFQFHYTTLSYTYAPNAPGQGAPGAFSYGRGVVPMALDIAALQRMYGADMTTRTEATEYRLTDPATTGLDLDASDGTIAVGRAYYAIWDAGGVDTISYSGASRTIINLMTATLSTTATAATSALAAELQQLALFRDLPEQTRQEIINPTFSAGGFFSSVLTDAGIREPGGYSIANSVVIENARGGSAADLLIGNSANNLIEGNEGDDAIIGAEGADTIRGDAGNDTVIGGLGDDNIGGGAGNDQIFGTSGTNIIWGGLGNDTVQGGSGNDTIYGGGSGTNQLLGNDGNDQIFAGSGGDFIGGGAGRDTIRGAEGADTIYGGLGDDNLAGGAGNDLIFGSAGANIIWAGLGNDTVQGGNGNDTISGSAGRNQLLGNDGDDLIFAGTGGDFIGGGAGNDTVRGGNGADTIYGGLGADDLAGGAGNDVIFGSAGANTLWGGLGNDTIHGGTGRDVMNGGPGADVFVFASAAHIGIGLGRDVISGFTSGADRIDLSALNTQFNGTAGVLDGGQASFFYFAASGLLIGDQNGDGAADWVLELAGSPAVTGADFLV